MIMIMNVNMVMIMIVMIMIIMIMIVMILMISKVSIFEIYFFFKSPNCNQRYGTVALWHSGTDYDDYSDDCDDYNYDRDYSNDIKGLYI